MATSAGVSNNLHGMPTTMAGASKDVLDSYGSDQNQENQLPRTQNATGSNKRQRSTSNLRAPLSTIPSGHEVTAKRGNVSDSIDSLYKNNNSTGNLSHSEQYDDIPENMYKPGKEDREGWIHREKLAKIENEELQAAGINLAKARSKSRDALSNRPRENSRDRLRDFSSRNEKRPKVESPTPEDLDESKEHAQWDLRTPEEIASDPAGNLFGTPILRKSGSKIPVKTSSPTPIPSDRYERETPMPRKRTMSGSLTPEDSLSIAKTRNVASDAEMGNSSSKSNSPTKARSKSVATSKPASIPDAKTMLEARKVSAPVKGGPSSSPTRPVTRGNDTERPRTANKAPEGDPPWLATMYKPDPMLPPDQQLIPTLAKKKQQEMWEANGEVPATYDRNFTPLALYDADGVVKQISSTTESQGEPPFEANQAESWPLNQVPTASKSSPPANRPTTSSGTGGYSTMPRVQSPPMSTTASPRLGQAGSPSLAPQPSPRPEADQFSNSPNLKAQRQQQKSQQLQHTTDLEDEKLQKKGCCCIVM